MFAISLFSNYSDHMLGCWTVVHFVNASFAGTDVNTLESWLSMNGLSVHNCFSFFVCKCWLVWNKLHWAVQSFFCALQWWWGGVRRFVPVVMLCWIVDGLQIPHPAVCCSGHAMLNSLMVCRYHILWFVAVVMLCWTAWWFVGTTSCGLLQWSCCVEQLDGL
jgi:hypothetical protein